MCLVFRASDESKTNSVIIQIHMPCPNVQVVPADVLSFNQIQHELQARQASVSKSEAREQAAIIQ